MKTHQEILQECEKEFISWGLTQGEIDHTCLFEGVYLREFLEVAIELARQSERDEIIEELKKKIEENKRDYGLAIIKGHRIAFKEAISIIQKRSDAEKGEK